MRLRNQYETFLRAVADAEVALPSETTNYLDPITPRESVTVVTWIREDEITQYQKPGSGWVDTAPRSIWVTEVPHLQEFCRAFVKANGTDVNFLNRRLEQHLGLAPYSAKKLFLELRIASADAEHNIFRPCASPEIETASCPIGPPKDCPSNPEGAESCERHTSFFYKQYYDSYGKSVAARIPWTSLGYTFDWAMNYPNSDGYADFVRYGESEYVVPHGAPIEVVRVTGTMPYCRPAP